MNTFRPAATSEAKPLIGLYAESGCGKTYGALLLAKGFSEDMSKVGMIETESGRGEVFADDPAVGGYLVRPIRESFSPKDYGAAISDAEKVGLRALIIDSASHEWEGFNGVLGMAAKNQEEGKKGPLVWQKPKMDHQREFMLRLMQTPIPLVIVCMRAKYPMKEAVKDGKKEWTRSEVLEPKQSDDILFEMMVHAWIDQGHRLHVTKYTKDSFRDIFIDGEPITVETGRRLAAWAAGGAGTVEERLRAAKTQDELVVAWGTLTREQRARYAKVKDEVKAIIADGLKLSNKPGNGPIDPMKEALACIKSGDFDTARSMKQYVSDTDKQFIEDEIEARQGVTK